MHFLGDKLISMLIWQLSRLTGRKCNISENFIDSKVEYKGQDMTVFVMCNIFSVKKIYWEV